jgi:hypothetical protein
MILRRITNHVKSQNWFAVGIDFGIVVLGVFIGLQVQEWSQDKATAKRQEALALEIASDLKQDLQNVDGVSEIAAMRFASAQKILNRVNGWSMPNSYPCEFDVRCPLPLPERSGPKSASDALFYSMRYVGLQVQRRSFETFLASGDATFISRPGLAGDLREHHAMLQRWTDTENLRQYPTQLSLNQAFARHGLSVNDQVDWQQLDAIVSKDLELQGILKEVAWEATLQYKYIKDIRDDTQKMITIIEKVK